MKSLRLIMRCMKNYKYLFAALCFMIGEGVFQIFGAVALGKMVDVLTEKEFDALLSAAGSVFVAAIFLFLCIFAKDSLMGFYLENGVKNLRDEIVKRITHSKYLWIKNQPVGELLSRSMGDTEQVAEAVRPVLVMGVSVFGVLAVIVVYMLVQNWMLTLVYILLIPIFMIVQWFLSDLIKKYHREYLTAQADLATLVSESANMQEIIKSLNAEDWVIHRFTDAAHRQKMMKRGEVRVQTVLVPINILCTYLPLIVLIIVGGIMVQWGNLSLGALLSFIVLGQIVSDIMSDLAGFVTYVRRLEVVTTRILDWWNIPQENWCFSSQQKQAEQIESVSFEDLAFAYEDSMQILKGITARAYRGDKIAVLGPSGSGKSTLLAILSSLEFPAKGEVKYNDRLFSNWDTSSLRGEIVYVEQQPYFFRGTVRENIECGTKYSEEEIKKCLYISDAYDFVAALPQGLNTIIGEKGVDLSGGEKQRLAITRALLKNASLLLLDEATSALDHNSEVKVINGLLSLKNNPIILFVTHKTNLAGMFDKRWVIEEGNLKEEIK